MKLEGKVAIVTGGASDIEEAIVTCFAREGTSLVIADIKLSAGKIKT
jgi:NAD(P)-dependent dehydrogenase (short-subunit alcohol dehydrogenase family)